MPKITKTKTTVYNISQVGIDMMEFNERYRQIRGNMNYKGFSCYSCNKHFEDGEKISLIITDKGNRTVCHKCGMKFKDELEDDTDGKE
jgi:protein-arginine kinase activator protein McsA